MGIKRIGLFEYRTTALQLSTSPQWLPFLSMHRVGSTAGTPRCVFPLQRVSRDQTFVSPEAALIEANRVAVQLFSSGALTELSRR